MPIYISPSSIELCIFFFSNSQLNSQLYLILHSVLVRCLLSAPTHSSIRHKLPPDVFRLFRSKISRVCAGPDLQGIPRLEALSGTFKPGAIVRNLFICTSDSLRIGINQSSAVAQGYVIDP